MSGWKTTNLASVFSLRTSVLLPFGTSLMALIQMFIQMFMDVRLVGFHPLWLIFPDTDEKVFYNINDRMRAPSNSCSDSTETTDSSENRLVCTSTPVSDHCGVEYLYYCGFDHCGYLDCSDFGLRLSIRNIWTKLFCTLQPTLSHCGLDTF